MKGKMNIVCMVICLLIGVDAWSQEDTLANDSTLDLAMQYYAKGDSLEKIFNYREALVWYEKGFEWDKGLPFIRKIAQCYMKRGQYEQSRQVFGQIPADSLTQMDLRFKYNLHRQLSEPDSMLLVGRVIIERYPFDSEIVSSVASRYNLMEMPDSALFFTERYALEDSADIFVNRQRAFSYYQKKEYDKALALYKQLLVQKDNNSYTYYYAGLCCAQLDSLNEAYDHLLKAHELDKENPHVLSQLGIVSINIGFKDEGIKYIEDAIALFQPDDGLMFTLHNAVSDAYFSRHKYRESIRYLNTCLSLNPSSLFSVYKMARTYGILKDVNNEKRYYQRFVKAIEAEQEVTDVMARLADEARARLQAIREEEFFKDGIQ